MTFLPPKTAMSAEYSFVDIIRGKFPRVSHLPNIVMSDSPNALKYLLRAIDRKGGIMYEDPPNLDDSGEHEFMAWKRKDNQRFLTERGCFYPQFVIDAHADIQKLNALEEQNGDWNLLVENIDRFRWFYAPVYDEDSIAVFVARELDRLWIERIAEQFDHVGIPYAFVFDRDGRDVVKVPPQLKTIWRLR